MGFDTYANGVRHTRSWVLVVLLGLGAGCASGDSADLGPTHGGQTGSLRCGEIPAGASFVGPDGRATFVVGTSGCLLFDEDLGILDANGERVDYEVEQESEGTLVITTSEPVQPGTFSVQVADMMARQVEVEEAPPEPQALGEISLLSGPACNPTFEFVPEEGVLNYRARLRLEARIDDGISFVWYDTDQVALSDGTAVLRLDRCASGSCLDDGPHSIAVTGQLAGFDTPVETLSVQFEVRCGGGDAGACTSAPQAPVSSGWLLLAAPAWLVLRSRRRRAPRT